MGRQERPGPRGLTSGASLAARCTRARSLLANSATRLCNGSVNLIVTGVEDSSTEVDNLRNRGCAVETVPSDRLMDSLKQNLDCSMWADAIVCFMEVDATELGSPLVYTLSITLAQRVAREVRRLPDSSAMQDGRKWKAIPLVLVLSGTGAVFVSEGMKQFASSVDVDFVESLPEFEVTFRSINEAVRKYRQRILNEFSNWASSSLIETEYIVWVPR